MRSWQHVVVATLAAVTVAVRGGAQSPEMTMREMASAQVKKGVRAIGFGGDGGTWGNYALVWKDASTALVDVGVTSFDNGNQFAFQAVAFTSPPLWHDLAVYVIALSQTGRDVHLPLKSPGLGANAINMHGDGADDGLFFKVAAPLGGGVSLGVLLSYEHSNFDLVADSAPGTAVRFRTGWRPSGGLGLSWQAHPRLLMGFRMIANSDDEQRTDPAGQTSGIARGFEYRLGVSVAPWQGALFDVGTTRIERINGLTHAETAIQEPNIGLEHAFNGRAVVLRAGLDESTIATGFSLKRGPLNLDVALLRNLGQARMGPLFGTQSNSVIATLTLDYKKMLAGDATPVGAR